MADTIKPTGQATSTQSTATQRASYGSEPATEKQEAFGKTAEFGEMVDQAKSAVNDAYQRTSQSVNETLGHAKDYSRENPGTTMMIAFGVGVGVGALLTSGMWSSGRSRSQRIAPPIINALSEIASEFFRR